MKLWVRTLKTVNKMMALVTVYALFFLWLYETYQI